jgi:hypothetical protein
MANNITITTANGTAVVSTEDATTLNGATVSAQHAQRFIFALRTGSATVVDLAGDSANGLDVDVTRVQGNVTVVDGGGSLTVDGTVGVSGSVAVTNAGTFPVQAAQSGTWTVQPGNTPNTTAWLVTGAGGTFPVTGTVGISGSVAVTGTFWQATQPVSGPLTDVQLRAAAVPISGNVGVTGAVEIANDAGNAIPVSGTFWQATQPVSGPLTDVQLRASAVPVSGTFFQATQPVSIASLPTLAAGTNNIGDVDVLTLPAGVIASMTSLPAGTNNIGDVDVLTLPALAAGTNRIGAVRPVDSADADLTSAKGAQTARVVGVQLAHDGGRNQTNYFMAAPVLTTAAAVLMSLTGYKGGAAVAATTTPAVVTAGKTYRVSQLVVTYVATATAGLVKVELRANTAGAVAVGSPVVFSTHVGAGTPATAGSSQTAVITLPEGLEFAAGTGVGITITGSSVTGAAAVAGYGQVALLGMEY